MATAAPTPIITLFNRIGLEFSGFIKAEDLKRLIAQTNNAGSMRLVLDQRVQQLNIISMGQSTNGKHIEFRQGICEQTANLYYFLVEVDTTRRIIEPFLEGSNNQRFFRTIIQEVFDKKWKTFWVPLKHVLEMGDKINPKSFTRAHVLDYLDNMVKHGYLLKYPEGRSISAEVSLTLGIRTLVECADTLQNRYGRYVKDCVKCTSLVLQGLKCNTCEACIHKTCYTKTPNSDYHCRNCLTNIMSETINPDFVS